MTTLASTEVLGSLKIAEIDKANRGLVPQPDKGLRKLVSEVTTWKSLFVDAEMIGNMQMFISRDPHHPTFHIYKSAGIKLKSVASQIQKFQSSNNEGIRKWTQSITPQLYTRVKNQELPPIICCYPGLMEAGNILDGNHRTLAFLSNLTNLELKLEIQLGIIPIQMWLLLMSKAFFRSKLPLVDRVGIALKRLSTYGHLLN